MLISNNFSLIYNLEEFYNSNKLTWGKKTCTNLEKMNNQFNTLNIDSLNSEIVITSVGNHLLNHDDTILRYKKFSDFLDKLRNIKTKSIFFDFFYNRYNVNSEFIKSFQNHDNIYISYMFDKISPTVDSKLTLEYLEKFRLENITPTYDMQESSKLYDSNPLENSVELMETVKGLSCVNVF
jgi:hypothetical protein